MHANQSDGINYITEKQLFISRESFVKQTPAGKVRLVSWQIDHITDELPLFLMQFEEFSNLPDERLDFGAFKFCFIVGATLVVRICNSVSNVIFLFLFFIFAE